VDEGLTLGARIVCEFSHFGDARNFLASGRTGESAKDGWPPRVSYLERFRAFDIKKIRFSAKWENQGAPVTATAA